MHRYCFISKKSDFEKIIEKSQCAVKKNDFTKEMHSYVSNVGFDRDSSKKKELDLMKEGINLA